MNHIVSILSHRNKGHCSHHIHVAGKEYLGIPIFLDYDQKEVNIGKEMSELFTGTKYRQ